MLFGVFATHSPESCPINNEANKKTFIQMKNKMDVEMKKYNINKIVEFYMSVLEHQWIIVIDAVHAHDIERLCIDVGISSMSTVKIVPMNLYEDVIARLDK
jgi:GTPase Era involved in 16S rRNA processing